LPFPPGYPAERRIQQLDALLERLRVVPGVTHAAYGTALPFVSFGGFTAFTMRSPVNPDVELNVQAAQRVVSSDYFSAMRLRLVAGRTLTDADTTATPPAIVVNRTFARQYLGERPLGFHIPQRGKRAGGIRFADEHADWEVVGVVDDMRQDVDSPLLPEIFASIKQITTETTNVGFDPILVVRTAADPTTYVSTLRRLVQEQVPALALDPVMTMEDRVMTSLAKPRLYAVVLALFGVFAVLIAGVGLFGACRSAWRSARAKSACARRSARRHATSSCSYCVRRSGLLASEWRSDWRRRWPASGCCRRFCTASARTTR
jgi:putative ABC transport system permease protein